MYTRIISILTLLLVTILFVAPAVAGFVTPSKPWSSESSFGYSSANSPVNTFDYSHQWKNLDGINPNEPSTMATLASHIKNMNFGPSPQRPFGWTPSCTG